ncbi:MAG: hypothetical protein M0P71_09090, partial [Melioribacteraceae bacterium]|nr:hypothetical protein [Melioribacteraceae bacterium]
MRTQLTDIRWRFWLIILMMIAGVTISNAQQGVNIVGSFEQELPSYWMKGNEPAGATLSWATDQSKSMGRSLKIEKT